MALNDIWARWGVSISIGILAVAAVLGTAKLADWALGVVETRWGSEQTSRIALVVSIVLLSLLAALFITALMELDRMSAGWQF